MYTKTVQTTVHEEMAPVDIPPEMLGQSEESVENGQQTVATVSDEQRKLNEQVSDNAEEQSAEVTGQEKAISAPNQEENSTDGIPQQNNDEADKANLPTNG